MARAVKRLLDVAVAVAGLLVAAPLLAVAAAAILLEDGRPVLFVQERAGRGGQPFRLVKLRTMRVHDRPAVEVGQVGLDDPLVTRVGRLARRTKLDELPQLVNVVRGEMSLVGPRPALPEQAAAYDEVDRIRLEVRPGLTGWAQVNGNVQLDWDQRIALDIWYVRHWSLALDVRILLRTVTVVVAGERADSAVVEECVRYADGLRGGG